MITREQTYRVACHFFTLQMNTTSPLWQCLGNYTPFEAEKRDEVEPIFRLTVAERGKGNAPDPLVSLGRFDSDGVCMELFTTANGGRMFRMFPYQEEEDQDSRLYISADYSQAKLFFNSNAGTSRRLFALNNALMLLYAFTTATLGTLLMHASVIVNGGKAYMFLGRSGTGKSTHSRLWLQHVAGSTLLNDDNPIMRLAADGNPIIYGSPWSGKTPCYLNEHAPLGAIVRLSQAPCNKITPLKGAMAYAAVLPSLSAMRWEPKMAEGIHTTLTQLTTTASIHHLQCLPDEAAAYLCSDSVREEALCSN